MHTAIKTGGHDAYNLKHYMVDTENDILDIDIDNCCMGSKATTIDTGRNYILNSKDEWVKQPWSSGGSTGGDSSEEEINNLKKQIEELQKKNEELNQ